MMNAVRALTVVALSAMVAQPASAGSLTSEERALLADAARAEEVITQRIARTRELIAARPPQVGPDAGKASGETRKAEKLAEKAQHALEAGDHEMALKWSKLADQATPVPEVRR